MKKLIAVLLTFTVLTGCETLTFFNNLQVTQVEVDAADQAYTATLGFAAAYSDLYCGPRDECRPDLPPARPCAVGQSASVRNICAEADIVAYLEGVDREIENLFTSVQAQLDACPAGDCQGLMSTFSILDDTVRTVTKIVADYSFTIGG